MAAVVPRLPAAKQRSEVSVKIPKGPYTCSKAAASTSPLTCLFPPQLHSHPINLTDVVILEIRADRVQFPLR